MRSGSPLPIRTNGDIKILPECPINEMLDDIFRTELMKSFMKALSRARILTLPSPRGTLANGYHTLNGWALICRTIVTEVPNIDQLACRRRCTIF